MSNFVFSIIKSSFGILTSRVFGLIRDITIAAVYGASHVTDAFFVAFAIPNLFRALFAEGALASAFVPVLSDKYKKDKQNAFKYFSDLLIVLILLLAIIILVVSVFSSSVILLFLPGYVNNPEVVSLASKMLVILMPYLLLVSICGLFAGFLNLLGSYFIPYSSTALLNIIMIGGALLGGYHDANIYYLAYSVILGGVVQLIYIYIYSRVKKISLIYGKGFDPDVKRTFKLIMPAIAGVGVNQLNFLVGRIVASFLGFGSISFLYYANRLFQFPLGVFSIAIGTVSLTELSKAYTVNDTERLGEILSKAVISILLVIIPSTLGLCLLSVEITALIYERLSFTASDSYSTAIALQMYASGLLFFSFVNLFNKVFHANKDTKTPVKVAFISLIFNFIFTLLLIKPFGHAGIALASTLAAIINSTILYFKLNIKIKLSNLKSIVIKVVISSLMMTSVLLILQYYNIHVIINIITCIVIYFASLYILKVNIRKALR